MTESMAKPKAKGASSASKPRKSATKSKSSPKAGATGKPASRVIDERFRDLEGWREETLARMQANKDTKLATENTEISKPEKLADLAKWTKFWELLSTYLGRVKGAALIPLSYLMQEHGDVTPEIRNTDYGSVQERLIATTAHSGTHYELDNCTLYDTFKP